MNPEVLVGHSMKDRDWEKEKEEREDIADRKAEVERISFSLEG